MVRRMKTAKELFEELGYKKYKEDGEGEFITYKKDEGFGFFTLICFNTPQKQILVSCSNLVIREEYHKARPISAELLKAINEQVDELGWKKEIQKYQESPKAKPMKLVIKYPIPGIYECPVCGKEFQYYIHDFGANYCSNCGQCLNWSDIYDG